MASAGGNLARYILTPSTGAGAGTSYTINKRPFTGTEKSTSSSSGSSSASGSSGTIKVDMPIIAPSVHGQKVYNTLPPSHTTPHTL